MFGLSKDDAKTEELKEIDEKKKQFEKELKKVEDSSKEEELKKIDEEKRQVEEELKKIEASSKGKELKKNDEKKKKGEGMSKIRGTICCLAFLFLWVVMMLLVRIVAGEGFFILCLPSLLLLMIPFEYVFDKITW